MFIGTPFQGADEKYVKVVDMRLAIAKTIGEQNEELVRYLESTARRDLDDIVREFSEMANNRSPRLPILCLFETRLTDFSGVVHKLPAEFRKSLDGNNKGIVSFFLC